MSAAQFIRRSVTEVERMRLIVNTDSKLRSAVNAVKDYQARRFEHTYRDLITAGPYQSAARFFLVELYGLVDYSKRDAQFARIAGAIERLFPKQAIATAMALAQLHVLTEQLDFAMGRAWTLAPMTDNAAQAYILAWRTVGQQRQRQQQLQLVLGLGRDLDRLTRTSGLRLMLKMMRGPAHAAGLHDLQRFLETGFDTFASLSKTTGGAEPFLHLIETSETTLMHALFDEQLDGAQLSRDAVLP
jgi:hypothetical protein